MKPLYFYIGIILCTVAFYVYVFSNNLGVLYLFIGLAFINILVRFSNKKAEQHYSNKLTLVMILIFLPGLIITFLK